MDGNLLFIDDDMDILKLNKTYFINTGFEVHTAGSPKEALELLGKNRYDCIILDIRMEKMDGYMLCRHIRSCLDTPVIFLTSLVDDEALVKGFSCGADDYVVKPYSLKELEARIRVRMHSPRNSPNPVLKSGGLVLDFSKKQAFISNVPVNLTINEFELFYFLVSHKGQPFTPESLYRHVWAEESFYNSHSIQTMILRIRKKLNAVSPDKEYIKTQWGKGYVFMDS